MRTHARHSRVFTAVAGHGQLSLLRLKRIQPAGVPRVAGKTCNTNKTSSIPVLCCAELAPCMYVAQ